MLGSVHANAEEREAAMEALSINEACRSMGIGKTKLYALIKARDIPARKIGAKTIILRQDVDSYLSALPAVEINQKG